MDDKLDMAEEEADDQKRFLNTEHLLKISFGEDTKVKELLRHAEPLLRQNAQRLEDYLASDDQQNFLRELHKIKGSLGVLAPHNLYVEAAAIEKKFRDAGHVDEPTARKFIRNLRLLHQEVQDFIS